MSSAHKPDLSKVRKLFECLKHDHLDIFQELYCEFEKWNIVRDLPSLFEKDYNFSTSNFLYHLFNGSFPQFEPFCDLLFENCQADIDSFFKDLVKNCDIIIGKMHVNILHLSLMRSAIKISQFLIENHGKKLIEKCKTKSRRGISMTFSIMYLIAKNNLISVAKTLFDHIVEEEERSKLINSKDDVIIETGTKRLIIPITWFHVACYYGSTDVVQFCLEKLDMCPNEKDGSGQTALFRACDKDDPQIISLLLSHKADMFIEDSDGNTPLHIAVRDKKKESVELLARHGKQKQPRKTCNEPPIFIACKSDNKDMLEVLVASGYDVSIADRHGRTAMHRAASIGCTDIMDVLYEAQSDLINKSDNYGKTPLHSAIENDQFLAVEYLIRNKVSVPKNVAVTNENPEILKIILKEIGFTKVISLFHDAAKDPNSDVKLRSFLENVEISNLTSFRDNEDNSILHIAARHGWVNTLTHCLNKMGLTQNSPNNGYNSPLQEASKGSHSCPLDALNSIQDTALHCAVRSEHDQVVEIIVKHLHSKEQLNRQNKVGHTALHLAAKYNRPKVVRFLTGIDPSIKNKEQDNALHVAARYENMEVLKELLEHFNWHKELINDKTADGETLLHLVAKGGHYKFISVLVDYGINLAIQDDTGNTFLHGLAEQAGADPDHHEVHNKVLDEIIEVLPKWWCKLKNYTLCNYDTRDSYVWRKEAFLFLRSEITNNKGLTALQLAVNHGAWFLVQSMIQVPQIFVKKSEKGRKFDITDLVPLTDDSQKPTRKGLGDSEEKLLFIRQNEPLKESLLETIVRKCPLHIANKMLDIEPLKQVADDYWKLYQYITCFFLFLHLVHMLTFSLVAIPEITKAGTSAETVNSLPEANRKFILFIIWPLCVLFQLGYRWYKFGKTSDITEQSVSISDRIITFIQDYFNDALMVTFSCLSFIWFIYFINGNKYHVVLLAYVELLGWLNAITFTRILQPMYGFTIMLSKIFMKDVLKFLFQYSFILLAFGFSFDCLMRLSPKVLSEFGSTIEVFFHTMGMLLGAVDIMVEDVEDKYKESGHSTVHYKMIYLLYALVTVVVLLNILIAMMIDSYGDIKRKEGMSFRVSFIQSAIKFEKAFPFFHQLKQFDKDEKNRSWMEVKINRRQLIQ